MQQEMDGTHLVLKETAAEGPDGAEDEVELVQLLRAVSGRRRLVCEDALEQVAQRLQVTHLRHRRHLLEA